MAFQVVQTLEFEKAGYSYDRQADVLDIFFGPPVPAIALQVEDWLAIRVRPQPPALEGMTIVGFRKIFERINRYVEKELPQRMKRLAGVEMSIAYDDDSDTLIMRFEEKPSPLRGLLRRLSRGGTGQPSIFEPLVKRGDLAAGATGGEEPLDNVYVEKSLTSRDIVGVKILQYTKCGAAAFEGMLGAMIDTLFEPSAEHDENVHLIARALFRHLDWQRFATLAT